MPGMCWTCSDTIAPNVSSTTITATTSGVTISGFSTDGSTPGSTDGFYISDVQKSGTPTGTVDVQSGAFSVDAVISGLSDASVYDISVGGISDCPGSNSTGTNTLTVCTR